ncbi:MAG: ribbon-helix-helix protein, CopG family [Thermoplasmata archaeon]|nr:MAG: ribbon-helix-helix protein, CopG family [Thermoplasmata archaeon]
MIQRKDSDMDKEGIYTKVLTIRIDPDLLEQLKREAKIQGMDISEYIRGCLRTGLYLNEMNIALRSRKGELY